MKPLPILVSVPHGGTEIPAGARRHCLLGLPEILADGDTWSRQLFDVSGDVLEFQAAVVGRAIVDLNRAEDDRAPANPDGVVKSRTLDGHPVWRGCEAPPPELLEKLLERQYRTYHRELEERAARPGLEFAVDCHTMLPEAPPGGPGSGQPRPLICLSNRGGAGGEDVGEGVSAPPALLRSFGKAFEAAFADLWEPADGRNFVSLNDPFRGGYITRRHGLGTPLPWIQVELNRCLYLDENPPATDLPPSHIGRRVDDLKTRFLRVLREASSLLGDNHTLSGNPAQRRG